MVLRHVRAKLDWAIRGESKECNSQTNVLIEKKKLDLSVTEIDHMKYTSRESVKEYYVFLKQFDIGCHVWMVIAARHVLGTRGEESATFDA